MSAAHGGGPQLKLPYIIAGVVLVFILSYIGHYQWLSHDGHHFSFWGVLYATVLFFFLHHADPEPHNTLVLIAELLAMAMFLYGIFHFVLQGFQRTLLLRRIRRQYHGHAVILGEGPIAERLAHSMDAEHRKSIWMDSSVQAGHHHFHQLLRLAPTDASNPLADAAVQQARHLIIATSTDAASIKWLKEVEKYVLAHPGESPQLQILLHLKEQANTDLIKDYFASPKAGARFDLEVFNEHQLAAQKLYDEFAPHKYLPWHAEADHRIAILGYNATAEQFLLENIILSHYPHKEPVTVYLIDEHADEAFHKFQYNYPYYKEFIELIPVRQNNRHFFASFTWSKEAIERISKVSAVYVFGDDDATLINTAASFRQFLYSQVQVLTHVPIVVCLPQNSGVLDTLDVHSTEAPSGLGHTLEHRLHIYPFAQLTHTCSGQLLIEHRDMMNQLAMAINFYYALLYDCASILQRSEEQPVFDEAATYMLSLSGHPEAQNLAGIEHKVLQFLEGRLHTSAQVLKQQIGAEALFARLSLRKRDSNRYAARHVAVKLYFLKHLHYDLSPEKIKDAYHVLAPIEHKRWCGEKMVYNFRFAPFPDDKAQKTFLKDVLKIHDQLIAYDKLTDHEKQKDLNLFLLLPLMAGLLHHAPAHPAKSPHS